MPSRPASIDQFDADWTRTSSASTTKHASIRTRRFRDKIRRSKIPPSERKPLPASVNPLQILDEIEQEKETRSDIHNRIVDGYVHDGGEFLGVDVPAFREAGFRTEDHVNLRLFASLVPKLFQASNAKDVVYDQHRKVLGLDLAYVVVNHSVIGLQRQDLDKIYESPEHLRRQMQLRVDSGRLPCLPHIVTGLMDADGRWHRPHAIWLLAPDNRIYDDRKGTKARRKWQRIRVGTCLELGADIGAQANAYRVKNPLCPMMHTECWEETVYPNFDEWAACVRTSVSFASAIKDRIARTMRESGLDESASNLVFTWSTDRAKKLLTDWHVGQDPRWTENRHNPERLRDILASELLKDAMSFGGDLEKTEAAMRRVASWWADKFDPKKIGERKVDRGVLADEVKGRDIKGRRRVAQAYATAKVGEKTILAVAEAIRSLRAAGKPVNRSTVEEASGITRKTVRARWDQAMAVVEGLQKIPEYRRPAKVSGVGNSVSGKKAEFLTAPSLINQTIAVSSSEGSSEPTVSIEATVSCNRGTSLEAHGQPEAVSTTEASVSTENPVHGHSMKVEGRIAVDLKDRVTVLMIRQFFGGRVSMSDLDAVERGEIVVPSLWSAGSYEDEDAVLPESMTTAAEVAEPSRRPRRLRKGRLMTGMTLKDRPAVHTAS